MCDIVAGVSAIKANGTLECDLWTLRSYYTTSIYRCLWGLVQVYKFI